MIWHFKKYKLLLKTKNVWRVKQTRQRVRSFCCLWTTSEAAMAKRYLLQ
jgi:hypothetical protein